ncbi:putative amidohydrolase [Grimontia indica]|uniref:Amidohydrolase n=1 Tax=Grimontia indica TaxID=1056512 RepID=R1ISI3_9GAMM|nr:carbon-nitrogen hydrolase family protein [Grimontia indica]EOD80402.1 putative amidohydrolase [Grimontia indica]
MTKFGVVQMNSGMDPEVNLEVLEGQLKHLKTQGARLVLTPENCLVFGTKEDYDKHAEVLGHGPLQKKLSQLAFELGIWLVMGSFPIRNNDGTLSTTCLVYDAAGNLRASYEKLHMFDVDIADNHRSYRESDTFKSGDNLVLVDTPFGTLGLSICYDVRFPQLYSALRQRGADIIIVPAAFTKVTGAAHWEVLLRARAIETQCWVLAAAQCGSHQGGRETYGHSMIVDPWGQVVTTLNEQIGTAWADVDLASNSAIRSKMPVMQHARLQCAMK